MSAATNASAYASQSGPRKRGGQADAVTNHLCVVPHTDVCGQHLSVFGEAMLRLASLLRTDHMLGGDQTSILFTRLTRAMNEYLEECRPDES